MKAYRNYRAAKEAAKGLPVLEVEAGNQQLYIVFTAAPDPLAVSEARVTLVRPSDDAYCGHISLQHLDRLGDCDRARAGAGPATERCFSRHDLGLPEQRPSMIRISPNVVVKA